LSWSLGANMNLLSKLHPNWKSQEEILANFIEFQT
jgi:hypothetical protein